MHAVGRGLLLVAFVLAALSAGSAAVAARNGDDALERLARRGVFAVWACVLAASALLLHFILAHDFSNEYVVAYSDTKMPWYYLVSSFWGGQKGSMLLWALVLTSLTALAVHVDRVEQAIRVRAISVWMVAFLFFDLVLVFLTDPFEQFLVLGALPDGEGLNPLLQNPTMTFHPPTILAGYAIWAVPFGYGVAALLTSDVDGSWLRAVWRWSIAGWLLLALGNLFGAYWAYEELGWGGYWGWDPVENASLLPWLTATPFLHALLIQRRRGLLRVWTQALLHATFALTIFGTFLTRTGLVQSVHAFASNEPLKVFFLAGLGLLLLFSTTLVVWRVRPLREGRRIDAWLTRETAFAATNVLFVAAAVVVLWGTLFPTINELLTARKMTVGPSWFNRFVGPIGVAILALTGVCLLLPWGRSSGRDIARRFAAPLAWAAALTALVVALLRGRAWFVATDISFGFLPPRLSGGALALLTLFLAAFVLAAVLRDLGGSVRARARAGGIGLLAASSHLVLRGRRRFGAWVIHLGVVFLFVGFAGGAFKQERELRLGEGDAATVGDYTLRFVRVSEVRQDNRTVEQAHIELRRKGLPLGELRPARFHFHNAARTTTTEVDYRSDLVEDIYLALVHVGPEGRDVTLGVVVNPLMAWLYVGTALLTLGALLGLIPSRRQRPQAAVGDGR